MLSKEDKKRLLEIKKLFSDKSNVSFTDEQWQEYRNILDLLCVNNVIQDLEIDNANIYRKIGDFGIFENELSEFNKEESGDKRRSFWRDVLMAAIGAVFGGFVTFLLFILFGIG